MDRLPCDEGDAKEGVEMQHTVFLPMIKTETPESEALDENVNQESNMHDPLDVKDPLEIKTDDPLQGNQVKVENEKDCEVQDSNNQDLNQSQVCSSQINTKNEGEETVPEFERVDVPGHNANQVFIKVEKNEEEKLKEEESIDINDIASEEEDDDNDDDDDDEEDVDDPMEMQSDPVQVQVGTSDQRLQGRAKNILVRALPDLAPTRPQDCAKLMPAVADLASTASSSVNSVATPNDNSVRAIKLKKSGGARLTSTEKLALKELGPPRPELNIYQVVNACKNKKTYNRKFKQELYYLADWLCGCGEKNRFYCYWCLVMGVKDPSWTEEGFSDLKHLPDKIKKHKLSGKHIHAAIEFKILGRVAIRDQVDSAYRKRISESNEQVLKNRYILSKLIDAVKFCGSFELTQDARENTLNPGIFRGIVNLMADVDVTLKQHIETTNNRVFLGLSKTIQKELLDSILSVCHEIIRQELTLSEYLAIEVDETRDTATLSQLVFLVRYELNGVIRERFVNFLIPDSHDAEGISKAIFVELDKLGVNKTPNKLIAQCYDGSSVLSGQNTGVQARIKEVYKNANFIHCYAHQFNLIVERSTTQIKQVRLFFGNLEAFSSFFSQSTKRTAVLDEVVKKRFPQNGGTNLDFNLKSKAVETISKYHDEIDQCLRFIVDDPTNDYSTMNKALGLQNLLDDKEEFMFWLNFFNKVMPHCDVLDNQLQHGIIDSINFLKYANHFKDEITKLKNSPELDFEYSGKSAADCSGDARRGIARLFTQGVTQCSQAVQSEQLSIKRGAKRQRVNDKKDIVAKEVCDLIMKAVNDRFGFVDHLSAGKLFEPSQFPNYTKKFPDKYLNIAGTSFQLNKMELRQELTVMYGRSDFFKAKGSLMLLNLIYDNNLSSVLPQSVKLLKIICTIPMATAESERRLSTLKQVKTFTRNTMKEERLSALAICSIEKELLASQNFNDRVMDHFSQQKDRQADFSLLQ